MTEEAKKFIELLRYMGEKNIGKRGKPPHVDTFGDIYLEDMFTKAADMIESLSATCDQLTDALKTRGFENIEAVFAELDQVKRERDAAVEDLKEADLIDCMHCKEYEKNAIPCQCDCESCKIVNCVCKTCVRNSNWQWRGVEVE